MLFRTVYGIELETIYAYIFGCNKKNIQPSKIDLSRTFIPARQDGTYYSSQNLDDAINFLKSAGLLIEQNGLFIAEQQKSGPFPIVLLQALRNFELGYQPVNHPTDSIYLTLLTELYIKPNYIILPDLHAAANQLKVVQDIGGLGKEKLQAWTRVMEYLGIGRRMQGNFMCIYSPNLIVHLIKRWPNDTGTLQSFFEDYFHTLLPFSRSDGELSQSLIIPLKKLANRKIIELYQLQDSPTRPYFGHLKYKGITYKGARND